MVRAIYVLIVELLLDVASKIKHLLCKRGILIDASFFVLNFRSRNKLWINFVFQKMLLYFVSIVKIKVTSVYAEIKEDLEVQDDCLLLKNSPFSGVLVKYEESIRLERNYLNGRLHGLQKSYFLNGQLSTITLYTNNVQNGRRIEYYECGSKKLNVNYSDGDLNGIYEEWCPGGILIMRKTFYKGKLIAIKSN